MPETPGRRRFPRIRPPLAALGFHLLAALALPGPGPAHAARLRQLTDDAARKLREAGWPVDTIVVRIDAAPGLDETRKPLRETQPLNEQALQSFEDLRQQLAPSPLADAIAKLLRHHRR